MLLIGLVFSTNTAYADVILLKRGGRVEGKIVEENDDFVKVRIGGGGEMTIRRKKIKKIIKRSDAENDELKKRKEKEFAGSKPKPGKSSQTDPKPLKAPPKKSSESGKPAKKLRKVAGRAGQTNFEVTLPPTWLDSNSPTSPLYARATESSFDLNVIHFSARAAIGKLRGRLNSTLTKLIPGLKLTKTTEGKLGSRAAVRYFGDFEDAGNKKSLYAVFVETGTSDKLCLIFRGEFGDFLKRRGELDKIANSLKIIKSRSQ